ncbi:hypothetical protein H7846_00260 [Edaphobacter sp. 4G125]|nr:hypothetical protein H7846_00260 [Edaphobacter sp. 4G125]
MRAYFAPVNRATGTPTLFDAAQNGRFALDVPPAPWIDLGWCENFRRSNNGAKNGIVALRTGAPSFTATQVRTEFEAAVQIEFTCWGKLQMALTCGSQQMNLLASNGSAPVAVPVQPGSTASSLLIGAAAPQFSVGDLVVVDLDYTGQTGYLGSGISGAYLLNSAEVNGDVNYIRRISLNVGRIASIQNGTLALESSLLAGDPVAGMQVSRLAGFVDREGSSFFQEWSALFVHEGEQGDRVIYHYPRLQTMQSAAETMETIAAPLERIKLAGAFRALPVIDSSDGERALCFRSYLPA